MKKIMILLTLMFGVVSYGQVLNDSTNIQNLNKQISIEKKEQQTAIDQVTALKNEIKKSYNSLDLNNTSKDRLPTLEAIYDFKTQKYITDELKPRHKQPVVLKIININKFANTVEILSNDIRVKDSFLDPDEVVVNTILKEDKPAEPINVPVSTNAATKVPDGLNNASDSVTAKVKGQIDPLNKDINDLNSTIANNNSSIATKQELIDEYEKAKKTVQPNTEPIIKYAKTSLQLDNDIIQFYKDIDSLKNDNQTKEETINGKEAQLLKYNDKLKNFVYKTNKLIKEYTKISGKQININRINAAYNSYIQFVINPNLTCAHYNNNKSICKILEEDRRNEYQRFIKDFDENYSEFIKQYNEIFNDNLFYEIATKDPTYGNLVKLKFDNMKKEVETLYTLVNVTELRKKLNNIEILDKILSEEDAFTVTSDPIQPLEDYVEFKVKIKQSNILGNSVITQIPKNFSYIEYARGGVRWDFSVGTVFDFGIKNQQFEVKEGLSAGSTPKTTYTILENNTSQYTPTIAGLLHTSFRSNSMFAFGFSLGVSIDLTSLNLNSFFPGVSLLIGKKEKTIFTVGPAFKKVNQIKSIYNTTTTYDTTIQVADITSEQFKIGFFVGISYNLTNAQKSKIKIAN